MTRSKLNILGPSPARSAWSWRRRSVARMPIMMVGLVLIGCDDEPAPATTPATATAPAVAPAAAPAPVAAPAGAKEENKALTWSYSPVGKRDPFRSYLATQAAKQEAQAGAPRRLQPTEEFQLGQYRLTGLVTGTSQAKAMVEDPKGIGHALRVGARIGRNGGRVTRISSTGFIVVEEYRDPATGKRMKIPITVKMPTNSLSDLVQN